MPEPILRNLIQPDIRTGQKSTYTTPVQGPRTTLEELNPRRFEGPRYFGFHNESSLLARIAQMGLAPNGVNLKIVQEMLRYGLPIGFDAVETLKALWKQHGGSPLALEGLVLLQSLGVPAGQNLDGILQVLSGGPLSHQLARLTMALRGQTQPQLKELERLLGNYWKLGSGDLALEGKQFQQIYAELRRRLGDSSKLPAELSAEFAKLEQMMEGQKLLAGNSIYLPFFQWKDKQPLPGELLVHQDDSAAAKSAGFVQLSLALETKNLGRITCNFTLLRENLSIHLDVQDPNIHRMFQGKMDLLRARLNVKTPYTISSLQTDNVGQSRTISLLVPKRRDVRRFGRVIGVM